MNAGRVERVVIVGGGTAGWMAAAALSKTMGKVLEITLIESDAIGTIGVGEATIPPLVAFNRFVGIEEDDFLKATKGTFKLGINFENWRRLNHQYFHSFGTTGKDHWSAGFQHFFLRGLRQNIEFDYGDYCLELVAALEEKFAHLPNQGLNYAYHIDSGRYAALLRRISEEHGVRRVEGKITDVRLHGETGDITGVALESGAEIDGDLFVDCSGFRGLLIEQALHVGFDDWSQWLPCDSAIAVQTASVGPPIPYTRSIARESGWQWRIPLQHRVGNGLVYCRRYWDDDAAMATLMSNVEGEPLTEPRVIRFRTGTRRRHWHKNCVAIGLSGGFIEPLESTSIHLIQRAVVRLVHLFPYTGVSPASINEFNTKMITEFEHVRDFIVLHYNATERTDTAFWRYCRSMELPDTLQDRLDLFTDRATVFRGTDELFAENSWVQVMLGQGVQPRDHHPVADVMNEEELTTFLKHIRVNIQKTVSQLPKHGDYVAQYSVLDAPDDTAASAAGSPAPHDCSGAAASAGDAPPAAKKKAQPTRRIITPGADGNGGEPAEVDTRLIGDEQRPVLVIDDFVSDPDAWVEEAARKLYEPSRRFYPGVQAYVEFERFAAMIAPYQPRLRAVFGAPRDFAVVECGFSLVTTPPAELLPLQQIPHTDTTDTHRLAVLIYLSDPRLGGTAFYRHRSTGFESLTAQRADAYNAALDADVAKFGAPPAEYITGDTPIYEQIAVLEAKAGRALIYPSNSLHSGMIVKPEALTDDPRTGRLTLNAFVTSAP